MLSVLKVLSILTAFSACLCGFSQNNPFPASRPLPRAYPYPDSTGQGKTQVFSKSSPKVPPVVSQQATAKPLQQASATAPQQASGTAPQKASGTAPQQASATPPQQNTCPSLIQRREWRTLSAAEKASYIKAVKCLTTKPSQLLGKGYRRFDDFQYVHCESRRTVHFGSKFGPFHHYYMLVWENALRGECGYQGGTPYWNWELDAHDFPSSPLFSSDPVTGLGTNGKNFTYDPDNLGGGIVSDGAFANWQILYPDRQYLERNFVLPDVFALDNYTWGSQYYNNAAMKYVQSQTSYIKFINALEGLNPSLSDELYPGPHGMLHQLLGGDMPKLAYAANDVRFSLLFFLVHGNVDRHYDMWVRQDPANRTMAFNGNKTPGNTANDASLDDELDFMKLAPNVKIRETMKWRQPPYCYTYV